MESPKDNQLAQTVHTLMHQVKDLEHRESERVAQENQRAKTRRRLTKLTGASLLALALVTTVAQAAPSVSMTCPDGDLFCFSPNTPAMANQINHNFAQLQHWLEQKVGTVGAPVSVDGNMSVTGDVDAVGRIKPSYSAWSGTTGVGDGGAGIVNDNGSYGKLMVVGNNSAGSQREVGIWDNLSVNGNVTSNGLTVSNKTLANHIRDYVRGNCHVYFGWRDSCDGGCDGAPSKSGWAKANSTCGGISGGDSECSNGWVGINTDGEVNGDDKFFVKFVCN